MLQGSSLPVGSRTALRGLFLFLAYGAVACFGLEWAKTTGGASPIWPAAGIGLAGLILGGWRLWPAIVMARLVAGIICGVSGPLWTEAPIALVNGVACLLPVLLIGKMGGIDPRLQSLTSLVRYIFVGAVGCALVVAVAGSVILSVSPRPGPLSALELLSGWSMGSFAGAVTIGPLVLAWSAGLRSFRPLQWTGLIAVLVATGLLAMAIFVGSPERLQAWHLLPLLVLAALAFDLRGASASLVVVAGVAYWATGAGMGPFVEPGGPSAAALPALEQFVGIIALTSLFLSVTADERRARLELDRRGRRLRAAEEQARARAEELQVVLDAAPAVIWVARDPECREIVGNRHAADVLRLSTAAANMSKTSEDPEPVSHFRVLDGSGHELSPDELPVQRAARGEVIRGFEETVAFDDGSSRQLLGGATPLYAPDGTVRGAVAAFLDITDRKAAETREHLLAREVDHRAKNILAIVQSVVKLTKAADMEGLRSAILGRIGSLARTHNLLAGNRWDGADLGSLVTEELAPYLQADVEARGRERIRVEGERLTLVPATAQSLALVIHELVTNAVKYGALSVPDGRLDVVWRVETERAERILHLSWRERGGPAVAPPGRNGFGLSLIRMTVERQLAGRLETDWNGGGLALEISVPVATPAEREPAEPA